MNVATLNGLFDELSGIQKTASKTAAVMRDLGTAKGLGTKVIQNLMQRGAKRVGGVQEGIQGMGHALGAFSNPIDSAKKGLGFLKNDWHSTSGGWKALQVGGMAFGGLTDAKDVVPKEDRTGKGRGRGERIGNAIGGQIGNLIGAPHGLAGGMLAGTIGNKAGSLVGRGVDKLRGYRKPAPQVES